MSSISETSVWLKFFTEAGIPAGEATNYAIIFTDNRIKMDMLLDLNRDYLRDMGIMVMGDIIAILKHAKVHSGQISRQRVMQASTPASSKRDATSKRDTISKRDAASRRDSAFKRDTTDSPPATVKKSTPATRMLEHYVRKEQPPPSPPSASTNISQNLSSRLGSGMKRAHEDDESLSSNKKSSVFNRLGDNSVTSTTSENPKITITMLGKDILRSPNSESSNGKKSSASSSSSSSSVFGRLVYRDDEDSDDDSDRERTGSTTKPLEYQGILKYSTREGNEIANNTVRKVTTVEGGRSAKSSSKVVSKVSTMSADTTSGVKSRLGSHRSSGATGSAGIFARESHEALRSIKSPSPPSPPESNSVKLLKAKVTAAALKKTLPSPLRSSAASSSSSGKKYVKKIVRVNKKTGEIVSEEKITLKTDVFSRLGN